MAAVTKTRPRLIDEAQIRRALALLHPPGEVFEIRVLGGSLRRPLSGYFDDQETAVTAVLNEARRGPEGIYVTLNPIKSELLARAHNRLVEVQPGRATTDKDTTRLRWFLIDCDPVRLSGISSTDDEHQAALDKAIEIADWLGRTGFPPPVLADSGNGAHLLYRVDLPTADSGLLRRVLETLHLVFSNDRVTVDTTTYNPARICKRYGTPAGKGDSTEQRPHRLSQLVSEPRELTGGGKKWQSPYLERSSQL